MDLTGKSHPLEVAVEWAAPMILAAAAGWAASTAGLPLAAKAAASMMALAVGVIAMRMVGAEPLNAEPGFQPIHFEPDSASDELLLDDPLAEVAPDSRVVQLFADNEPTPGELVLRISDYLTEQGRAPAMANGQAEPNQVDASAALHSALANIRATLR